MGNYDWTSKTNTGQRMRAHYVGRNTPLEQHQEELAERIASTPPDCELCQQVTSGTLLLLAAELVTRNGEIERLKAELSIARGLINIAAQRLGVNMDELARADETGEQ